MLMQGVKGIARPKMDKYDIEYMVQKIITYIEKKEQEESVPILKECVLLNDWNYDYVMELQRGNELLSHTIKKLLAWKEVRLEQGALTGKLDKTMAIFSLKQPAHGWTDRVEYIDNSKQINDLKKVFEGLKADVEPETT